MDKEDAVGVTNVRVCVFHHHQVCSLNMHSLVSLTVALSFSIDLNFILQWKPNYNSSVILKHFSIVRKTFYYIYKTLDKYTLIALE